jgi:hypothetical protein
MEIGDEEGAPRRPKRIADEADHFHLLVSLSAPSVEGAV